MWVEADCNITGGESLVRQFLHGKNFFMDEFGVDVHNLWIPDVFGYSAAIPQIMQKAGVDFFLTQKLSWSRHNEFPHNTFRWRGIDGTEVITHFPPENDYNGTLLPSNLCNAQTRFKENAILDDFTSLFGIGNGGGGPSETHIENGLRLKSLNGAPTVKFGTAESYFEKLRDKADQFESWSGELYLEVHRGTFTTQAATKKGNRKLELKLRETEMLCSMLEPCDYPRKTLDATWKKLLTNQFHDILPGSSIRMVYEQAERDYADGIATCNELIANAAKTLFCDSDSAVTLMNSLGAAFSAPIRLPDSWAGHQVIDATGSDLAVQEEEGGCFALTSLAPYSLTSLRRGAPVSPVAAPTAQNELVLENEFIRYTFAPDATISSIYDKQTERECLPEGDKANLFSLYVDIPHCFDAWDIDLWYEQNLLEHAQSVSYTRMPDGPVRNRIRFELKIGSSTISQQIVLPVNSRRLDFETNVDWREMHRMLRVAFPTTIRASEATCEIQYGYLRRPTHRNTSWDMAKFEVASHRYVDLSDHDSGMAVLNDCKYGYKLAENVIDLNLLRSPTEPDPDADYGKHSFTYSLLPHNGSFIESEVIPQAAMLNQPPLILDGCENKTGALPCRLEAEAISLEVLKRAEKGDEWILRLVETRGRHSSGTLILNEGSTLTETDLMEWNDGESIQTNSSVELELNPFEIRTYKLCSS